MTVLLDQPIVQCRLYSLREVNAAFHVRPDDIIRYASDSQICLCVLVPTSKRVYHFELADLDWDLTDFDVERVYRHLGLRAHESVVQPDPWAWPQITGSSTLGLIVDSQTCNRVLLFGRQRKRLFRSALQFNEGPTPGAGQARLIRPLQEFLDVPEDMGPEQSFDNYFLGVYGDSVRFESLPSGGVAPPEEMEISPESLYILGEQLEIFLTDCRPAIGHHQVPTTTGTVTKSYPPAIPDLRVPTYASGRLKAFKDIAVSYWQGIKPGLALKDYQLINSRLVDELHRAREKGQIPLAEDEVETAAGIIRPLWARSIGPEIKETRLETFVTPEFEKMVLVAGRIDDWKKALKNATGAKARYAREHPSDETVIKWLADSEHFSVSRTHKAPVATKLLRSVAGARKSRTSKQAKSGTKKRK